MKPKNDTGPANGTLIFSLPPKRALSGLSRDSRQNALVPRNVSPMRVTCVAVSSLALPMKSDESLRRPRRRGGFRTSFVGRCPNFVERDRLRRRQRHPVLRMAIDPLLVVAAARDAVPFA